MRGQNAVFTALHRRLGKCFGKCCDKAPCQWRRALSPVGPCPTRSSDAPWLQPRRLLAGEGRRSFVGPIQRTARLMSTVSPQAGNFEGHDPKSYGTIIVGGGSAGCVMANRLSAHAKHSVLLLEAGADTAPGSEPADILDVYPTSYYNSAYKWPALKVHWRNRSNSPLTTFDQGRIIGGGSTVVGMVALRGIPEDYDEWDALGARGWAWKDVLPYFRKLEHDFDFGGDPH